MQRLVLWFALVNEAERSGIGNEATDGWDEANEMDETDEVNDRWGSKNSALADSPSVSPQTSSMDGHSMSLPEFFWVLYIPITLW